MLYGLLLTFFFILFAIITWRDFVFGVALFSALLPTYLLRFSLGPLPSTALEIMFVVLFATWLVQEIQAKKILTHLHCVRASRFFYPGVLLVVAAAISVVWATDKVSALGILKAYFLEPFILYIMLVTRVRSQDAWKKIFIGLGVSVLAVTVMALFQRLTGLYSPTWEWTLPETRRVTGPFTSPNALGLLVIPITTLFLAWRFTNQKWPKWLEIFSLAVISSGVLAVIIAVSKGAMIAFIATAFVLLFLAWSPKKTLALAVASLFIIVSIPSTQQRLLSLIQFQEASGQSRLVLYEATGELLQRYPLTGLGLASFADVFETVRPDEYYEELIYPHNIFLNFWSETGLLGLLAIVWIGVICMQIGWRFRHQRNGLFYSWVFLAAVFPMLIHGLVDVPYFKNDLAMLTWILLAGLAWSAKETEREKVFCS